MATQDPISETNNDNILPEGFLKEKAEKPLVEKPVLTPKTPKAPKPLVEGINAPAENVAPKRLLLTDAEKKLIENPDMNLEPEKADKKAPAFGKPVTISIASATTSPTAVNKKSNKSMLALVVVILLLTCGYAGWVYNETFHQKVNAAFSSLGLTKSNENPKDKTANNVTAPQPAQAPTPAPPVTPPAPKNQVKVTETPVNYLNVRNAPTTAGQLLGKVYPGEIYTYTETKNGWYHITISETQSGWVIGTYVEVVPTK